MSWKTDQKWEQEWHGNCVNSINEELKQFVYARKMGLKFKQTDKTPYSFDLGGVSVLDIGGGAYSLLLKCVNFNESLVADPCEYPDWVYARYESADINFAKMPAEKLDTISKVYDEVWIYNVLQHTMNPKKIIENAYNLSKIIRIFEWIEQGISVGHPQNLHEEDLNKWLKGIGKTEYLNESGCVGTSYYGIFKGKHYDKK